MEGVFLFKKGSLIKQCFIIWKDIFKKMVKKDNTIYLLEWKKNITFNYLVMID